MTDNLNFGNPYKPENFFQLQECVRGLAEACRHFDLPVVGGNVSLYNESPEGAIDPTPTVSVVGMIAEERHITRQFVTAADQRLILFGGAPTELGGSQFLGLMHGLKMGDAPAVDLGAELQLQNLLLAEIAAGHVAAAHDLSEGGLLVAVSEMLFGPERSFGATISLQGLGAPRLDALLYGESQGRALVAVRPGDAAAVLAAAAKGGVPAQVIGQVTDEPILAAETSAFALRWAVAELRRGWETTIEEAMRRPGLST